MTKKTNKNYNISIDIGTNSVGWAVTNEYNQLLKAKGNNMWGSCLFEEGKTAASTCRARTTTRRIRRRKIRISLLKDLMGSMVLEKDPNFFMKLEKGFLTKSDKGYDYNLFTNLEYTDKNFYEQFPTIYHLRKRLMQSKEKVDIRLIYLAIHHIVKYRGNFLYEGQNFNLKDTSKIEDDLLNLLNLFFELNDYEFTIDDQTTNVYFKKLKDKNLKKKEKVDYLKTIITFNDSSLSKSFNQFSRLLIGYDVDVSLIFPKIDLGEEDKIKIKFDSDKFDENLEKLSKISQKVTDFIELAQKINSYIVLRTILNDNNFISDAMIQRYDKHHSDLKKLKSVYKQFGSTSDYNDMFRNDEKKGSYSQYIKLPGKTSIEDLYKTISKFIEEKRVIGEDVDEIKKDIDMDCKNFLLCQNSKENGEIPYQLHLEELKKIIDNQSQYYEDLKINKDKILSLVTFRIPYYIGPLNIKSRFSWVKRKDKKIYPWNFTEVVDEITSAEAFIRKMTNQCTYLLGEEVLPKKSLLYSKYEVLNELNKIRINGKLISIDLKQEIYHNLFMKEKTITKNKLIDYLYRNQIIESKNVEIKGFQKENGFATSLESWIDFKKIFGNDFDTQYDNIEKIIEWITVYEDKKILKKRIKKEFPEFDEDTINLICNKKYKDWGRLSKRLLSEIKPKNKENKKYSIIDYLYLKNMNFMEIINDKKLGFDLEIKIANIKDEDDKKITYNKVKNLYGSPAIKKGIWQTVKIVKEIISYVGCEPQSIIIEFAREDKPSKRTKSRLEKLNNIYTSMQADNIELYQEACSQLKNEKDNQRLADEKLYLYYLQNGKCLYSGNSLEIENLNLYQVDHILPQSYIKDDSIDNKALVYSNENQYKGDNLLLNQSCISKQFLWWKTLKEYGLMSEKKFNNLTRKVISEEETVGFINRQLVETRQIVKHVANLFNNSYPNTNIIAIKAELSSIFRSKYDFYKLRNLNDFHHAHDAYIASVISNFILKKYPVFKDEFIFDRYLHKDLFKKDVEKQNNEIKKNNTTNKYGFIINQIGNSNVIDNETGEVIWEGKEIIKLVRKTLNFKDCFISKKAEEKTGQFFDLTKLKSEEIRYKKNLATILPLKKNLNPTIYGGYSSFKNSYAMAIEYKKKNKTIRTLINIPIHLKDTTDEKIREFIILSTNVKDVKIICKKILFNQEFEFEGSHYYLASATEWNNATQLLLSEKSQKILNYLFKNIKNNNKYLLNNADSILDAYDEYIIKLEKFYPMYENFALKLKENRDNFINLTLIEKKNVFNQMLLVTKANSKNGNITLEDMNISSRIGRINGKQADLNKIIFIHKSVTGLFEKKYSL